MTEEKQDIFERIRKAVEEREKFLEEHPELRPLQEEIERRTKNAGTPENRMAIIEEMMMEKVRELQDRLMALRGSLTGESPEAERPHLGLIKGSKVIAPQDWHGKGRAREPESPDPSEPPEPEQEG